MKHDVQDNLQKLNCKMFLDWMPVIHWTQVKAYSRTFSGFMQTTGSKIRNQIPWHIITWLLLLQEILTSTKTFDQVLYLGCWC